MSNYLKLLSPQYRKYIPELFKWEFFSEAGLIRSLSPQRKLRKKIQHKYEDLYPKGSVGYYSRYDWMRLELSLVFCKGPKVLEVGPYNGAFAEMLTHWSQVEKVVAVDIEPHPSWTSPNGVELIVSNITKVQLDKKSFNTVSAQEIIEHLPVDLVDSALSKIRDLAQDRIIASLPFKEPYPLHRQDHPSGHKQSFDEEKIKNLFPNAYFFLAQAGLGSPWIIIIEDFLKPSPFKEFKIQTPTEILSMLNS